ncbi:MAG: biotin/lipoyl-binding protein [Ferruginibacter sp.]
MPDNRILSNPLNNRQGKNTPQHIYSQEISDIISNKPNWIVRNGILLFLLIICFIIAIAFFIEYPDVVNANARIVSANPPIELKTKQAGKLYQLFVKENDRVNAGDILGRLESVADADQIINLSTVLYQEKNMLDRLETEAAVSHFQNYYTTKGWGANLGELQAAYQIYIMAFQSFRQYLSGGFYLKKRNMLQRDNIYLQQLHANLLQQKGMQEEDVSLAKTTFEANQSLRNDKIIAPLEYRNERSKFINKALSLPQLSSLIINNETAIHEKKKEILQLENDIAQQKNIFVQALNTLIAEIEQWEASYLLKPPIKGCIAFTDFIEANQHYPANQTICLINPTNTNYYAQVHIPQQNFGKLKNGQKVLLKLPAYPHQQFGIIKGRLNFISMISSDSGFIGKIILSDGLKTSQQKSIQFREGLRASAEIITSDRSLASRIWNSATAVFSKN